MNTELVFNVVDKDAHLDKDKKEEIADFLYHNLEQYGDPKADIMKAINYVFDKDSYGGKIIIAYHDNEIKGVVVLNKTGMQGYIPETILVYIAVKHDCRGMGFGKQLMNKAKRVCDGNIALHVEEDNPAKFLYEKVGFVKKYAEMRLVRD